MSWTTPADIKATLERRWERGHLLSPPAGVSLFPLHPRFSRPEPRELADRFDEVRRWIRALEEGSRTRVGFGYEIDWIETRHRQLGANRIPSGVVVPTPEDALALIGKRAAAERWRALREATGRLCPTLEDWVDRKPLVALEHAAFWERLLAVVNWFRDHPRPGLYVRQIDLPGVGTKFIEAHRALIAELLDLALPPEAVRRERSARREFELRYGLRAKPVLVRFRILDERLAVRGLTDVAAPAHEFAQLDLPVQTVFITENEINGLAFPPVPDAIVLFGLGYGLLRLAEIEWLRAPQVHYWGDIDTHGFAMLDRLRSSLPQARSFLMDRETLIEHRSWWGEEPSPHDGPLARLNQDEAALYQDLLRDRFGTRVRLEQERIGFAWIERALRSIELPA